MVIIIIKHEMENEQLLIGIARFLYVRSQFLPSLFDCLDNKLVLVSTFKGLVESKRIVSYFLRIYLFGEYGVRSKFVSWLRISLAICQPIIGPFVRPVEPRPLATQTLGISSIFP